MNTKEVLFGLKKPWAIIGITLLLVSVVFVLSNQSFKASEEATFNEFNERQLVLAMGVTSGIELYFESVGQGIRAIGKVPEISRLEEARTREELRRRFEELEQLGVNDIGVLDEDGVLRYGVNAPQLEGTDFSFRRYYQEAKEMTSPDIYIIEFIEFKGVKAGEKGVLVTVPMFDFETGEFAGVVLGTIELNTIVDRFVAPVKSSENGQAFLIDEEYNVLYSADRSLFGKNLLEETEGFPEFQQIMEHLNDGTSGKGEYTYYRFDESSGKYTDEVEEKLVALEHIQLGKETWVIGVWAPKEKVRLLIRSAYIKQILLTVLIIVILLLGSAYAIAVFSSISKILETEVGTKTKELREAQDNLEMRVKERTAELSDANLELENEMAERMKAEEALRGSEEKYHDLFENALDGIVIIDAQHNFSEVNNSMVKLTGYSRDELLKMNVSDLVHPDDQEKSKTYFEKLVKKGKYQGYEGRLVTKTGEARFIEVNSDTIILDGEYVGSRDILRDITERKLAENEMKRRLMKYKLDEGTLYLAVEQTSLLSTEAFKDLLKVGYPGVIISRTSREKLKNDFDEDVKVFWISEKGGDTAFQPDLKEIEDEIENLTRGSAVLIDRLDYLVFKNGFKKTLTFVQHLKEIAYFMQHFIILSVDPSTFSKRELGLLEKETDDVEPLHKARLSEELLETLRFIYRQNSIGVKPSYTDVRVELNVSKPTVRKRIKQLVFAGYLIEVTKGRFKVLELTEKSKNLFLE